MLTSPPRLVSEVAGHDSGRVPARGPPARLSSIDLVRPGSGCGTGTRSGDGAGSGCRPSRIDSRAAALDDRDPAPAPRRAAPGCTGASAVVQARRPRASSTMRPRYITATRSLMCRTIAQVVRDEQVGEAELVLQVLEQVDDLRLDRDVERRDRLVADDELRARARGRARCRCAGAGRRRTRAGSGWRGSGSSPTSSSSSLDALAARLARWRRFVDRAARRRSRRRSCADSATTYGSWKIICMSRRIGAQLVAASVRRGRRPRTTTVPAVGSSQPEHGAAGGATCRSRLSPTRPSVSPRWTSKRDAVDGLDRADLAPEARPS